MHAHASDKRLTESGSAKFFVKSDGSTVVQEKGVLTDIQINKIQKYIKKHYMEMYLMWSEDSEQGFYEG
jgi:hypothetical protein